MTTTKDLAAQARAWKERIQERFFALSTSTEKELGDLLEQCWQARAALSHPSTAQGWISVNDALPPEREMVAVGWMDVEDHDHADRYSIDYLDDGVWQFYFSEHEHYLIAGVAKGRSEDAPYTHWHRIGKIPPPPEQGGKG